MPLELPRNPETKTPIPNIANTVEENETLIQEAKVRLDEIRGQQAFYLPLDFFDVEVG